MTKGILHATLLGAALLPLVFGQTDAARLAGTVTDASGAVLSGAGVSVRNERTGEVRQVKTDLRGGYAVTPLPPASYSVIVEAVDMAAAEMRGITLQVGQERTLDVVLLPAGLNTEVTVGGGELVVVDTSSARVGANVSGREVGELPLNGRQVSQLYLMAPGAVNNGSGSFDNIRFSGRSNQQNVIRFDGVEGSSIIDSSPGNLNGESTSLFRLEQSLENVQEFRVDTSNYPAEYGTGTGGQVSFITRSGSNDLHGALFEYLRNDRLDARNFFDGAAKSQLRLNQFGGSLGGRLVRDRAFFFASYEGLRQHTSSPIVESTLSAAARAQAVPAIRPLLAAFPVGQYGSPDPLLDIVNVNAPARVTENAGGVRFDFNLAPHYRLYVRYFRDQGESFQTQNSTGSAYTTSIVPQNGVAALSQVLAPTVVNETKFGFNAYKTRVAGIPGPSPDANINGLTFNLSGSVALAGIAGQTGSAGIAIPTGLIRLSSAFNGRGAPYTNYSLSFIDNLSVVRGQHSLKFGVEIRPLALYNDQLGGTTFTFPSVAAFLANQPSSIQFNGDLSARSPFTGLAGEAHLRQNYTIAYAQDEYRLLPGLTVNYGLRFEYYSPMRDVRDKNVFFDMTRGDILPGYRGDWIRMKKSWGPRLALSWSPERLGGTVFRVGAGYYYGPGQTEDQVQPSANDRIGRTITSGPLLAYPVDIHQIYESYDVNSPTLGYQPRAYAPGYSNPERILSYTASVQQELPGKAVITVAYVGSQGRNLFLRSITNKIVGVTMNPATGAGTVVREFGNRFAEIDYKTSGGTDRYDSLQATLNRRYGSGLSLGMQYTWGRSVGNSAGSNEAITAGNPFDFDADRGSNNFDIRHSLNLAALYELPFGAGRRYFKNAPAALDAVLGGWQLGGIVNARSGVPIDVLIVRPDLVYRDTRDGRYYSSPVVVGGTPVTVPVINTPGGGSSRNVRRPDLVAGADPYLRGSGRLPYLNPAAFSMPAPGAFGNSSRNGFSGPGMAQLDLTLGKKFRVAERTALDVKAEVYNILNRANFANPGNLRLAQGLPSGPSASGIEPGQPYTSAAAGGNFGVLSSTVSNQIGIGTNRQIQLALRLTF